MDLLRARSTFPTLWHPIEYMRYKRNFQPKLAPPRKKPACSSLKLTPAKFAEEFGVTINPPTLNLHNGNYFTFTDGQWVRSAHCKIRKGTGRRSTRPSIKSQLVAQGGGPPKKDFAQDRPFSKGDLSPVQSSRNLKSARNSADCKEVEDYWKEKLAECERRHLEIEDKMRKDHQHEMDAKQSQIECLIGKCNDLKGENNLLQIKVSKMLDMLAECAAEVNLQEAELAQCGSRRPSQKRPPAPPDGGGACFLPRTNYGRPKTAHTDFFDDEDEDEDDLED